ncbi:MAG: cytochrome P450 [Deltaproteobacteria bacterium]|nr:cytochrome P450 [Deltaproteobacteria bacterium]
MSVEFDPFSTHLGADPYPLYRELREQGPVHHAMPSDIHCITRYEEARSVLGQPELFSSRAMETVFARGSNVKFKMRHVMGVVRFLWRMRASLIHFRKAGSIITIDPPRHGELRSIVNRGFTPKQIAGWEPWIRQIVAEELGDKLERTGDFDAIRDLAIPLPTRVIMQVLGIEKGLRADFKRWSDAIISGISGPGRHNPMELGIFDSMAELMLFLRETIRERRASPGEDLISLLVDPSKGHALGDAEAIQFVVLLLVAGNETTTNLIGNGINALYDHPDQLALLLEDPTRVNGFIEETLRFDPPIQIVFRRATRDTEIAGVSIPKGAYVAPMLACANRDDRKFPNGDRFDILRDSAGHLGFGFGLHFCLGSALARLQAQVALEAIMPHLGRLQRRDEVPAIIDSFLVRGRSALVLCESASA